MSENDSNKEKDKKEGEDEENPKMIRINEFVSNHKYIFRICLLGDSNVGKTSLLTRFCDGSFKEKYNNTIGVDFRVATLKYKDIVTKIHIWDTAGQERFRSIAVNYFRSSHGFIYIYDITDDKSFKNINSWIDLASSNNKAAVMSFLVGNKSDLEDQRKVTVKQGENLAREQNFLFFETSAKTDSNVQKMFEFFTYKLIQYYNNNNDKYNPDNSMSILTNSEEIKTERPDKGGCKC